MKSSKQPISSDEQKFWEENFRFAATSHWSWQYSARELQYALAILHKEIRKSWREFKKGKMPHPFMPASVGMMLCGLMLEDLFKAVLVSRKGAFNSKGDFLHKTHNLLGLADNVGLKLSVEEGWLLEKLTSYIEWKGKYPIPLVSEGLMPRLLATGDIRLVHSIKIEKEGDIDAAKKLAKRIEKLLPHRIRVPRAVQKVRAGRKTKISGAQRGTV
jgi:hypothetical protein